MKNRKPLTLPMSAELVSMLRKLFRNDGQVFDRTNFRKEWITACVKVGLGKQTGEHWYQYEGLIPHDFRRSAVRNLTNAGVETAKAMKITGHKTTAVFLRYDIVTTENCTTLRTKWLRITRRKSGPTTQYQRKKQPKKP